MPVLIIHRYTAVLRVTSMKPVKCYMAKESSGRIRVCKSRSQLLLNLKQNGLQGTSINRENILEREEDIS
jgi:hypothetical protein